MFESREGKQFWKNLDLEDVTLIQNRIIETIIVNCCFTSGLRTRSRTGYELESVDEINNSDRRYLYATTFDTADGMSPMPAFHISPSSTPDVRSLQWY